MHNVNLATHDFGEHSEILDRALLAAERTIELDPNNQSVRVHKATAHFFRDEMDHFHDEADRALSLNPNDAETLASLGYLMCRAGWCDEGAAMIKKAISLNPFQRDLYQHPFFLKAFLNGDYETALGFTQPQEAAAGFWSFVYQEVEHGDVRDLEAAQRAAEKVLTGINTVAKDSYQAFSEIHIGDLVRLADDHDAHSEWMVIGRSFCTMTYDLSCGDAAVPDRVLHNVHVKFLEKIGRTEIAFANAPDNYTA